MDPNFDPTARSAIASAVQWLNVTFLGGIATGVAVIAVVFVGFALLSGRIDLRRGAQVILGCFILFGASAIAQGIVRAMGEDRAASEVLPNPLGPTPAVVVTRPAVTPFDPYARAATPTR